MKQLSHTEILLIGGSAGSITVLLEILRDLDVSLAFAVVVILHRKASPESTLADLLAAHCSLPVTELSDKTTLERAHVYLAPADYHVLFDRKDLISLDYSEKINYSRPSIDVTFQSAGTLFRKHTTALLLSGANNDGLEGLRYIEKVGGTVLVQDPSTAEVAYMPQQVVTHLSFYKVLKSNEMTMFINKLNTAYY